MLPTEMRAAVMTGTGRMEIQRLPVPQPGPGDVLINVKSVGVCGSDVHLFAEGRIGPHIVHPPYVLGHEASGKVVAVGEAVSSLSPGDRITMEPGVACGHCRACRRGQYNLCPDMIFWAAPPAPGVLLEYVTHPARYCVRIPDHTGYDEAALAEPLSVGIYAAARGQVAPGKSVAILGVGTIGQMVLQCCLAYGASQVIVSDIEDSRLKLAEKLGSPAIVNAANEDLLQRVADYTDNAGVDVVFEAAGNPQSIKDSVAIARKGGKVIQIGNPTNAEVVYPLLAVLDKELKIYGSYRYAHCYPVAVEMLASGKVDVAALISHHYPLEKAEEAFVFARDHKSKCMKIVIEL